MTVSDELIAEFDQAFSSYTGGSRAEARRAGLEAFAARHERMVLERVACQPPGVAVLTEEDLAVRDAEIERQVRQQIIDAFATVKIAARGEWGDGWNKALDTAVAIARGDHDDR